MDFWEYRTLFHLLPPFQIPAAGFFFFWNLGMPTLDTRGKALPLPEASIFHWEFPLERLHLPLHGNSSSHFFFFLAWKLRNFLNSQESGESGSSLHSSSHLGCVWELEMIPNIPKIKDMELFPPLLGLGLGAWNAPTYPQIQEFGHGAVPWDRSESLG